MAIDSQIVLLRKRPISTRVQENDEIQQTQKQFLRKTRQGRVLKVVREHYLRSDIPCGSKLCDKCDPFYAALDAGEVMLPGTDGEETRGIFKTRLMPILSQRGRESGGLRKKGHYLIIDTNVALHQMDLLEHSQFGADIIILQTVLDEVKHRSLPIFNRLQALIKEEDRRIWLFYNEARWDTFASRKDGETPNDRNDRAIRKATLWYQHHLILNQNGKKRKSTNSTFIPESSAFVDVILLSDDAGNRREAENLGLQVQSVKQYVSSLPGELSDVLSDLVAQAGEICPANISGQEGSIARQPKTTYAPEYLAQSVLQAGVKAGSLHQGYFNLNAYNYKEGSVKVPALEKPILLIGAENMNRSVTGDSVVVELLDESEWRASADEVLEEESEAILDDNPGDEEADGDTTDTVRTRQPEREATRKQAANKEKQPTGRIVGIVKRGWRSYVCHLDRSSISPSALSSNAPQSVFALSLDRKIPKIRFRTRQVSNLIEQKFLVAIDSWEVTSRHPEGHLVRALGKVESKEAEIESLLLEHDVPYRPFSKAILNCLPSEGEQWVVPPKSDTSRVWQGREDLRDLVISSIDPVGCQDIDDALHARQLSNGNMEAGVHIADVSYFVHPDNPMDAEAESRGTTVYLVDKRIDMLPSLLGTNLCSLRPHVERLAFSVIWELDQDVNIINVRFTKSVIASKEAFTYEAAQKRKDNLSLNDPLTKSVRLLNSMAIKLKAKRMAAGALNLASPEVKIHQDSSETTGPIDVEQKQLLETNSLVEEFMLLANISVARKIHTAFPQTAVLRRHLPPPATNFEVLVDVLHKRRNINLDVSSSKALADSLDQCVDPTIDSFNTLVRIMATRCMLSAEYFCSGSVSKDTFGHYGLASEIYTHFTSPIRRYADVLVHRQLTAAITASSLHATLHSKQFVEKVMENINKRHRSAQQAGRASVEFYVALALQNKEKTLVDKGEGKVREEAFVIRAFRNGLAVFVSKFGLEGLVMFKRDNRYNAETYEIEIPKDKANPSGPQTKIGVFDKVTVEITVEKDKYSQRGRVRMFMVQPVDSRVV